MMTRAALLRCLLLVACCLPVYSIVIGIDLGTQWFKVAVVKPGAIEIILNEQTARKTPTTVGFYDGRLFGTPAQSLIVKKPERIFTAANQLLGKSYDHPVVNSVRHHLHYKLVEDTNRGTYGLYLDDETTFTPEEIVGMILSYAKQIAETSTGSQIKDCVITVPAFYTQYERAAVVDAAKLGGLNVLSLLNDGTAVAINYGIERTFGEDPVNVLFYDMGDSATRATLVSYRGVPDPKKKNATIGQLQTTGVGWDLELGGRDFDHRIALHLAAIAAKATGKDPLASPKPAAKLAKEAKRVKEVLTANNQVPVSIEGLLENYDLKTLITRAQFEELCADLFERATLPIKTVLQDASLQVTDVNYVQLFGGGTRVPKLQSTLQTFLNREELDKNLNTDEAAVFGAAFYAASLSTQHRVKEFRVKDTTPFGITVSVAGALEDGDKQTNIFRKGNRVGAKKTLSFHTTKDFELDVQYDGAPTLPPGTPVEITRLAVGGVPTREEYNFTDTPKIQASFRLDTSGLLELDKAEAELTVTTYPTPKQSTTSDSQQPQSDDQNNDSQSSHDAPQQPDGTPQSDEATNTDAQAQADTEPQPEAAEKAEEAESSTAQKRDAPLKPITRVHRVPLKVEVRSTGVKPLTAEQKKASEKRLAELALQDIEKKETEKAKNALEAHIYATKEKLQSNEEALQTVSTADQIDELTTALADNEDWLYSEGEAAPAGQYKSRLSALSDIGDPIFFRLSEITARPKAVEAARTFIEDSKELIENFTKVLNITDEDKASAVKLCDEIGEWLTQKEAEQASAPLTQPPAFTSTQVYRKLSDIETRLKVLARRPKKKPPKPPVTIIDTNYTQPNNTETDQPQDTQADTRQPESADHPQQHDEL